jgi:hypothetical protein
VFEVKTAKMTEKSGDPKNNRALSTLKRLKKEKDFEVSQHTKFRYPKQNYKPPKLLNVTHIDFCLPSIWRNKMQQKADTQTKGNLSAYIRTLIAKDLKVKNFECS